MSSIQKKQLPGWCVVWRVRRQAEEGRDVQGVCGLRVHGVLLHHLPDRGLAQAQGPLQGKKEGRSEIEGGSSSSSKSTGQRQHLGRNGVYLSRSEYASSASAI